MTNGPPAFGVRLWVLIGALLLVAGGVVGGLVFAWHRVIELEAKLTTSHLERFQLASEVRRELQSLNDTMLRYALLRDPRQWNQFALVSSNLDRWIDEHDPALNPGSPLTTESERRLFGELNRSYDDYLGSAMAVHSNVQPALVAPGQLAQLDAFNDQAARMREIIRQLSDAHRTAEASFLADATTSLDGLGQTLMLSIAVLLILVAALGWVIYRDTIAPMRTQLVQNQTLLQMQEKLVTLGTLAAGIAHEIRNPLTSLKARLYTLEKHLQVNPAAKKDTDVIAAEITRLERIVQDVLSFARPSDPRLETVPAEQLLLEIQGLMSPGLENRGVKLIIEPMPDLSIRADTGHMKQVLINLVSNAADAIEGTGTITLRARAGRVDVDGHETDATILEVSDTGKGIPPEVQKRLFDPFFSTKETGTGLGLPIAARIVAKHGGVLQYQTRPGQGTTFGVVLPSRIQPADENASADAHSYACNSSAS